MKRTITFNSYLIKILIIAVLFIALPMLFSFGGGLTTTGSYIRSCLCFFTLTFISVYLILGKKYLWYYSFAFIIQILIGLVHYLIFLDSNYFNTNGTPIDSFWHEFNSVFGSVDRLISYRKSSSFFGFDSDEWNVTHGEIWKIITIPYYFLGNKWLNYSPLNAFSSLLASINIMVIYNNQNPNINNVNDTTHKWIRGVTAYFPLFLLNDTLWRDAFGVALISIGLVLLTLSNSTYRKVISLVVLVYFSFLLRNVYVVIVGLVFAIKEINLKRSSSIILLPIVVLALYVIANFFQSNTSDEYVGSYVNQMSVLALPLKIIFGLIGPFPWTQFLMVFEGRVANAYQLGDYLLGLFQLGYLFAIVSRWKRFSFKNLDYLTLMGFGIALSGFISNAMHIGYIAEGIYFTIPWFFTQIGSDFKKYLRMSFVFLLSLNLVVIMLGGLNISSLWR